MGNVVISKMFRSHEIFAICKNSKWHSKSESLSRPVRRVAVSE